MAALRAEEPVAWWEALKWEVGRRCRALAAIAYRREVQDYHRALARFLSAVQDINRFHQRKRRQRLQAQRYRAKGPVVAPEEWARTRAAGGPKGREQPRPFVGLRLAEGDPVEDSVQGMLGVMGRFYGDLFTPRRVPASGEVEAFLQRAPFPAPGAVGQGGLTEQQRAALVAPVSPEEVRAAIKAGRSASAPGADGLPYFFFQCFADLLAKPLVAAFNAALQGRARFSDSFFAGLLRFFFKGGDPTLAQNWHPIAITNVNYRLLARVLNARLAAVASRLVAEGQTNAVPGRRMGNSLALMRELFLAAAGGRWQRLLVQLDQSKAFDRVDRAYLWAVLHARGVPEGYIRLLQRLYERATAVPTVEGWRGEPVPLASGLRQGCPLSPLLYVLALDPLLETVRADGRIAGVLARGSGRRLKAVAHADDAYVLLTEYGAVSGAAVNTTKSQCYALGPGPPDIAWRPLEVVPGAAAVWAVKVLGVHFGLERAAWETDWRAWAEAVRERIVGLSTWRLDIYQRVRFFSVYCVPAALGLFSGSCGAAGASRCFGQSWSHSQWALWWWHGDQVSFRLTAHLRLVLPAYLQELAVWVRELKVPAALCRHLPGAGEGLSTERCLKAQIYGVLLARTLVTTGVQLAGVLERVADALDARRRLMTGSGYNPFLNVSEAVSSENDEDEGDVELEMDVEPSRWTAGKQRSEETPVLHCQKTGLNSNISGEMRTDLVRLNSGECNLEGDKRSGRLALQVTLGMQRRDITGYGRKLKDIVVQRVAAGQNVPGVTGWN
ncbi:hypothetical protein lerEdw1_014521 [Lerista edwardsae]|nr:hypothetical protein lerEdw1_014521 [Lerista edwardsae]